MCIYCGTEKYRRIYENHYGKIPKEPNGRSYEIHHVDGNHNNNDPINLIAVTLQEHYDIHLFQKDYAACVLIGRKLGVDPETLAKLNRQQNKLRVLNGTHHLLGGEIQKRSSQVRAQKGILGFQNQENLTKANKERDKIIQQKIKEGSWILQNKEFHKKHVREQIERGLHCSQKKITCIHCNNVMDSANYNRSHGENCKILTGLIKKTKKHPPRLKKTCEKCGKTLDSSNFGRHGHGPNCVR
jgi:hypothetical protein